MSKKERERGRRWRERERERESARRPAARPCAYFDGGDDEGTFFSGSISAARSDAAPMGVSPSLECNLLSN